MISYVSRRQFQDYQPLACRNKILKRATIFTLHSKCLNINLYTRKGGKVFQKCLVCTKDVNGNSPFIYMFVTIDLRMRNPA
jgi:hypothetical protein